ncbi:LytTR family DNA-binding domain-containing protein [Adlercreutzia faecimuris]|uniref:LytTR family transcriptional regulator DNA-binding domain-containing protein n=1 Tax=Adlercreutzia faecimuris TaxID=2897341 RepID=A0ABS9WJ15_9ACTN|nr:LytTR family transcriptional regulator DNA-binding domain-containing protein [Adlercreutzia sp. JBNU-10]MCI2242856.1 LytTR family transcriptional regulator DNA-binding domain-containing protein [Adlercreutzia sp. JBNU-10]
MEARQDQAAAAEGAAAGGGSAPARGQAGSTALPTEYASAADLVRGELGAGRSVHLECSRAAMRAAREAVQEVAGARRAAFYLEDDGGFDRDTVRSYLRFFARLAGDGAAAAEAIDHFGLRGRAGALVSKLTAEERVLLSFARMSLFDPEVCFCERPLLELGPDARQVVLGWIGARSEAGTLFVTCGQPLREALLMPGRAFWEEEGRFLAAEVDDADDDAEPAFEGDEVRVCKIAAKAGDVTLLLDPREIDFIESANRVNYASVRGELYPTALTMDELEGELERFGFFRCHRSYIVNVQKVAKVERYTRNTYNLVLSDARHSSLPLSKGRAEEMRDRFRWK